MSISLAGALKAHAAEVPVEKLDFTAQRHKMSEILGWHPQVVDTMERQYKQFIALSKAAEAIAPDLEIVPNRLIDEFWHMHILDTRKYREDCDMIFGRYFDHYPYFGLEGGEDTANWKRASTDCARLWEDVFDEPLYELDDTNDDA